MNKKRVRITLFFCAVAIIAIFIYGTQYSRDKRANNEAVKVKAAQDAAAEHKRFLEKYVDTGITKRPGNQMVAVAVASENRAMNHGMAVALISHFKTDRVQLTDSFFKPELVTDGLFNSAFSGSSELFNKLELTNSLDALLLARQTVQYETNSELNNVITANMTIEIATLPVAGQSQSQSWSFTANGTGFRRGDARVMAEDRIIKQIESDKKMSLGL
jgi:hypothetical protein